MTNIKFNLWILLYDDGFQCLCGMYNQAYRNVFGRKNGIVNENLGQQFKKERKKESAK